MRLLGSLSLVSALLGGLIGWREHDLFFVALGAVFALTGAVRWWRGRRLP